MFLFLTCRCSLKSLFRVATLSVHACIASHVPHLPRCMVTYRGITRYLAYRLAEYYGGHAVGSTVAHSRP